MRLRHSIFLALALITHPSCATNHRARFVPETRTAYWGYVEIEQISLSDLKYRLDSLGCHTMTYADVSTSQCRYKEAEVPESSDSGIEIYPLGPVGMGHISFWVTERRVWAGKDLFGSPDPEKYKDAVRTDVGSIGNIVRIKEDSWKILRTSDATGVVY